MSERSTVSTSLILRYVFFFFNDTATTEIYTLSLHDALPIFEQIQRLIGVDLALQFGDDVHDRRHAVIAGDRHEIRDRKSTRLNSSHANISYAVFCLKKNNNPSVISQSSDYCLLFILFPHLLS